MTKDKPQFRKTPDQLIVGPLKHICGMIHDAEGHHICDVRGWGRIQYYENAEAIQDKIGNYIAEALTEYLKIKPCPNK